MAVQRQPSHQLCQGSPLSIRPSTPLFPSCLHLVSHVQQKHNMTKMSLNQAVLLHFPFFNFIASDHQGASQVVLVSKEPTCQYRRRKRHGFICWVGKIAWKRAWQPTPVFLPGESRGQGSLSSHIPWGHKVSDMTEAT